MRARLTVTLLALFVALDVVLVALSFRHTSAVPPESPPQAARGTPSDRAPETVGSKVSGKTASLPPGPAYLDLGTGGRALWASRGDCNTSQAPQVYSKTDPASRPRGRHVDGLTEVLGVQVGADGSMSLVGTTDGCQVARWTSTDTGRTWSQSRASDAGWYLTPDAALEAVITPGGRQSTPCVPVNVSSVDTSVARLLCDDGTVEGTSDGGASWVPLGRLDGAVSIDFATPGDGVALATQRGCRSAVMTTSDGGTTWGRTACLKGARPRAISAQGQELMALVGSRTSTSADGGLTWTG